MTWKRQCSRRNKTGSAVLVVLVMLGTIAALAAIISRSVSTAAVEMIAARATSQSEADLNAGIALGVAAILKLDDKMRSADAVADLANRRINVHITNERGRIDLNVAPAAVLAGLLVAHGVDETEATSLAAAVGDWRGGSASQKLVSAGLGTHLPGLDSFDTPIDGGTRETPKQTIGTRYFLHPTQLASVPGFSHELVRSILPSLTVANASNQIDPFIAPRDVLEALPGTNSGQVDGFIEARDGNSGRDTAILLLGVDKTLVTDTAARGWRLEIVSSSRNGRTRRREAIVVVVKGSDPPFHVLYVDDERQAAGDD